ncbi:MAG: hypothetical protein LBM63_04325 [Rikenellaceae bacterium]|jgi:hypothetical protein|nr:hypothetical protein [Rikenellaceae bacterium]
MKRLIIIAIALLARGVAVAQEGIDKQLEVTRAYTPKVEQAAKLAIEPRMVDTVRLTPEVRYSITPTAWQTVFETPKYAPALLSVAPFALHRPLYLRAGLGYPLQSTADLYYNPYMGNGSTFGLWFNHRGSYSRIKNDLGLKPRSTEMLSEMGLYGAKNFGRRRLEGSLSYDHRLYNAYGVAATPAIATTPSAGLTTYGFMEGKAIQFGYIGGRVAYGDAFADLGRLNFAAGVDVGLFSLSELDFVARVRLGRMYGKHGFEVNTSYRGAGITFGINSNNNSEAFRLSPEYLFSPPKVTIRAGVDISNIHNGGEESYWLVLPRVLAKFELAGGAFEPFVSLSSELVDNSRAALVRQNPYTRDGAPMGWTLDARVGFGGTVGEVFSYRLWAGSSLLNEMVFFVGRQTGIHTQEGENHSYSFDPLVFVPVAEIGWLHSAGAELGLDNLGGFSASLRAKWYDYRLDGLEFAPAMPSWDAGLHLAYERRRFAVRAGVDVEGERKFLDRNMLRTHSLTEAGEPTSSASINEQVTSLGTTLDVSLGVEYSISDDFGLFVEGRNLAGQRLYPFAHYPGLPANLLLGIKATF